MNKRRAEFVDRIWYGRDALSAAVRTALLPVERLFGGVVGARDILYDAGWLPARETALPAVSVGNLTVGGTGKTPVAAWIARGLETRGARPAIILRGYGDDEALVHRTLNPHIPVVVGVDRVAAIARAAAAGADIAVLDDAFQHRRAHRVADIVLVSADRWTPDVRLLPAGPWREPLHAIRRATLIIVTRKAADAMQVEAVHQRLSETAPNVPRLSVALTPEMLVQVSASEQPERVDVSRSLDSLQGASVFAVLSVADPGAFVRQLEALGARVKASVHEDHHAFTAAEVAQIAGGLSADTLVVCTLKDAVKLAPLWPRLAPPLWYVSQQVMVERGVGGVERVLDDLVRSHSRTSAHAG